MDYREWLSDLCISELLFAKTYTTSKKHYPMRNKSRHHHGFIYTLEGAETYIFQDKKITTPPGTTLYIPKGEAYTIELDDETNIVVTMEFELPEGEVSPRPFLVRADKGSDIKNCFLEAEHICNVRKYASNVLCKSLFYKAVYLLLSRETGYHTPKSGTRLRDAVEYIHENYRRNDFRISDVYAVSGISAKYFETLFRQEYGITPKEYLTQLRIEYAKVLLENEKYTVGDAAFEVGYSDIYHFSKIFKAKTGMSPGEVRRMRNA